MVDFKKKQGLNYIKILTLFKLRRSACFPMLKVNINAKVYIFVGSICNSTKDIGEFLIFENKTTYQHDNPGIHHKIY